VLASEPAAGRLAISLIIGARTTSLYYVQKQCLLIT
jgi:hypothetical protein